MFQQIKTINIKFKKKNIYIYKYIDIILHITYYYTTNKIQSTFTKIFRNYQVLININ